MPQSRALQDMNGIRAQVGKAHAPSGMPRVPRESVIATNWAELMMQAIEEDSPNLALKALSMPGSNANEQIKIGQYAGISVRTAAIYEVTSARSNGSSTLQTITHGDTALHVCVKRGIRQVAKVLVKHGARTDIKNSKGLTAEEIGRETRNLEKSGKPARQPASQSTHGRSYQLVSDSGSTSSGSRSITSPHKTQPAQTPLESSAVTEQQQQQVTNRKDGAQPIAGDTSNYLRKEHRIHKLGNEMRQAKCELSSAMSAPVAPANPEPLQTSSRRKATSVNCSGETQTRPTSQAGPAAVITVELVRQMDNLSVQKLFRHAKQNPENIFYVEAGKSEVVRVGPGVIMKKDCSAPASKIHSLLAQQEQKLDSYTLAEQQGMLNFGLVAMFVTKIPCYYVMHEATPRVTADVGIKTLQPGRATQLEIIVAFFVSILRVQALYPGLMSFDMKPENLLFDNSSGQVRLGMIDFESFVDLLQTSPTRTTAASAKQLVKEYGPRAVITTPQYQKPEFMTLIQGINYKKAVEMQKWAALLFEGYFKCTLCQGLLGLTSDDQIRRTISELKGLVADSNHPKIASWRPDELFLAEACLTAFEKIFDLNGCAQMTFEGSDNPLQQHVAPLLFAP